MLFGDDSVWQAVKAAARGDEPLSYRDVQAIIRAAFDHGLVTVQEREDLRMAADLFKMDSRAARALNSFLAHVDRRSKPADEVAAKTGNKQMGMPIAVPDPGRFEKRNTSLGKFSHGTFDAAYDPDEGELNVTLKVNWKFEAGVTANERLDIQWRLRTAVRAWDNAKATLETANFALNPVIRVRFKLQEVTSGEHFTVDVANEEKRPFVAIDINI